MAVNNDSLQESILIRRAKRRLIGALFILIILITLSFFFLQDRSQIDNPNQDIKVSFKDSDLKTKVELDDRKPLAKVASSSEVDDKKFMIQVGIFSDKTNASKHAQTLQALGYDPKLEYIELEGRQSVKLITESFESESDAEYALLKIKKANLPGMIKIKASQ